VTFRELKAWLQAKGAVAPEDAVAAVPPLSPERQTQVDGLLRGADWLVFAMRDVQPAEAPGSDALKLFLKSTSPEGTEQRLVALAFGAPYYLDTTEIAKLTAYYAVYSRTEAFLEVAVRAVFGDEPAPGASPVSVSGAGYDLAKMLEPAREDVGLELVGRSATRPVSVGANLTVRTGTIYDGNGHEVPDETPVTFRRFARSEGLFLPDIEVTTEDGHATASVRAERPGELEIAAVFANGLRSEAIVVTVEGGRAATAFPGDGAAVVPVAVARPEVDWGILLLSLGAILLAGAVAQGVDPGAARAPSRLVRLFLISLCWGLAGYLLVAAGGVRLDSLAGGRLWPRSWSPGYQAPLFSFVLALLAVVPSVARALRLAGPPVGSSQDSRALRHPLPGGQDGQEEQ